MSTVPMSCGPCGLPFMSGFREWKPYNCAYLLAHTQVARLNMFLEWNEVPLPLGKEKKNEKKKRKEAGRPRGAGIGIPAEIFVFDLKGNTFFSWSLTCLPCCFAFPWCFSLFVVTFLYTVCVCRGISFWHPTNEIILSGVLFFGSKECGEPSIAVLKLGSLFLVRLEMSFAIVLNCLEVCGFSFSPTARCYR